MRKYKQYFSKSKKEKSKSQTVLYERLGEPSELYYIRVSKRFESMIEERKIAKSKIIIVKDNETQKTKTISKFSIII